MELRTETKMHGAHQITYDAIFQHPVSRNLQWREVRSLLDALADQVQEDHNGNVKFTLNGQTVTVHPPRRKDFSDVQELMKIRHFLEHSATLVLPAVAPGIHLLVVIDHREARIFEAELHGTVPQRIAPFDPQGTHRYLHSVTDDSNGQRKPELKPFYDAVTASLGKAEKILILGSATGSSSAMDHLVAELKQHHPEIAKRVVGAIVVDGQHMTDDQLLAQARKFFAVEAQSEASR
jgi:hypothetical protein